MSKAKLVIVGSFPKGEVKVYGGIFTSCQIILESSLSKKYLIETIDSTHRSFKTPNLIIRFFKGLQRLIILLYKLIFKNPDTVLLFISDGLSAVEKGIMTWVCYLFKCPVLVFPRAGNLRNQTFKSSVFLKIIKFLFSYSSIFLCQGYKWENYAINELGIIKSKVKVVNNWSGTLEKLSIGKNRKFEISNDEPRIVFIGWLENFKGVYELLQSCINLRNEGIKFHINFIGKGSLDHSLRQIVNQNELENTVTFSGWANSSAIHSILETSDIFVLPSWNEGMPNSLIEAMSSGLAVVVTPVGEILDYIENEKHALVVDIKNEKKLQHALKRLILDKKLRKKIALNGFNLANKYFSTEKNILLLDNVIELNLKKSNYTHISDYQICTYCIMDTSDSHITFDTQGRCNYCNNFDEHIFPNWQTDDKGYAELMAISKEIKSSNKKEDFDCIVGLSGGLDSSYAAYVAVEKMGLRPLLFHVDAGWNTDRAVGNIEKLIDGLGLDLYTEVVNWEEVKNLQVAFLRSGIPDQDLIQDAAFFSALYKFAHKNKIKHIITGSNFSTECCREPEEWGGYLGIDTRLFKNIWQKFGKGKITSFPLIDIFIYKIWYQRFLRMKIHYPLNLVPFIKKDAEDELNRLFGWQKFKHKHHESRFTRFYEDYWLVRRFGFQKRRAHFSSLILTGQMTRDLALKRISLPEMDEHFLEQEFEYIAHKLDLTFEQLQELFDSPKKTYKNYKNKRWLIGFGAKVMRLISQERRFFR